MIKLTMVEGVMTVNLKLPSEARYTTIYTFNGFDSGFTSTGYICFWAGGNDFVANKNYELRSFYKIDDIKIENLDNKPNYKETEFVSNRVDPIPDFDYNDTWTDDFLVGNRKDTDGKGCGAASAATLAVAIGALGFALLKIKR